LGLQAALPLLLLPLMLPAAVRRPPLKLLQRPAAVRMPLCLQRPALLLVMLQPPLQALQCVAASVARALLLMLMPLLHSPPAASVALLL
jgi:hypothetical protein